MGCLVAVFALISPRFVLFLVWVFELLGVTRFLSTAYDNFLIPFLGFLLMPLTTLAWAWTVNSGTGLNGIGIIVLIVAVLFDLGLIGLGGRGARS
jgi:hypothetical protein